MVKRKPKKKAPDWMKRQYGFVTGAFNRKLLKKDKKDKIIVAGYNAAKRRMKKK